MKERSEGAGRRGEPTPSEAKRPEKNQPILEVGEGRHNVPPPQGEQSQPQQDKGERQPLPSVLDILEHRAQLYESPLRRRIAHEDSRLKANRAAYREFREKRDQLGNELATLYAEGTDRDRLILDVYTTLATSSSSKPVNWSLGLQADETRQFIAKVAPLSDEELREELRTTRESAERKAARYKRMAETQQFNRSLPYEERYKNEPWFKKLQKSREEVKRW